jgi:cobalt-zinc-cadmium efflux system outer membrane protein
MNIVCRFGGRVSLWLVVWAIPFPTLIFPAQAAETPPSIKQAFEAAWARQPEVRAAGARREAVGARRQTADSWLAEPPSLDVSYKTDQLNRDQGSREYEAGLAMPLWLPGERAGQRALAEVEGAALESQLEAVRLRTAGEVREAWWSLALARIDLEAAEARRLNTERLAADVARRVKAGDLSRADGHQADAAVAGAVAEIARSRGTLAETAKRLRSLTGVTVNGAVSAATEPTPSEVNAGDAHPLLKDLAARVATARAARNLAGMQSRANPELRLAATRDRANAGDAWSNTLTLGVRIPFGSDSRQRARVATATAEETEVEAQLAVAQERIAAEIDAARQREEAARARLAAAEQRVRLANESRGFFEKSFRLGETDLPTRLRIESEAAEAEREAARARIELAASVSALRQALGLLPE